MGQGYCDVQIRIMVGAIIGAVPACVLAISRSLAGALDTNRQMVHQDRRDKMKGYVFEAVLCFGLPIFYMVAYYVVQNVRYFIVPVYGCDNRYDGSWISVVLFFVPPVVMTLFSSYYTSKFPFIPPHPPRTTTVELIFSGSTGYLPHVHPPPPNIHPPHLK